MIAKAVASIGLMIVLQALIALRVGTEIVAVEPIFALDSIAIGSMQAPTDRIWLAVTIVAIALVATLVFRFTRFGTATEAAAESEKGAYLTGLSPTGSRSAIGRCRRWWPASVAFSLRRSWL